MHVIEPALLYTEAIDENMIGEKDENGKVLKVDLDRQLLKSIDGTGKFICYESPEYVRDMGTLERLRAVEEGFIVNITVEKYRKSAKLVPTIRW